MKNVTDIKHKILETISKEEAKELLLDIERTLRVEDGASDMALKGVLLSSVAVLMGLV